MRKFLQLIRKTILHPRSGIKDVCQDIESQNVIVLILILSISLNMYYAQIMGMGDSKSLQEILNFASLWSLSISVVIYFVYAMILVRTGTFFGGVGTQNDMRLVIAWSALPWIFGFNLELLVSYTLFDQEIFSLSTPLSDNAPVFVLILSLIELVTWWTSVCFMVIMLSELHKISKMKAFAAMIASVVTLLVAAIAFRYGMYYLLNFIL